MKTWMVVLGALVLAYLVWKFMVRPPAAVATSMANGVMVMPPPSYRRQPVVTGGAEIH